MSASNRTLVSSILFLDIVEYSKQSMTNQQGLKQRFNALLADALKNMAPSHRIVLDTGDGAAISFQVNPEDSMFVAMHLRDAINAANATEPPPQLHVRFGINLGPVRLIPDLNGKVNIVGDGINVAQRVMSFAKPGSILVSRSYYDVVSHLTDEYTGLFTPAGTHADKHAREYAVYEIGRCVEANVPPVAAQPETRDASVSAAEEKMRREEQERARAEAEERRKQEAEEKRRREAELSAELAAWEQAQREQKERERREAEEKARADAEERARREEALRIRREAEEKARAEAERQARAEAEERMRAEELRKREEEEQKRRDAELRARLAEREQARREEEEQARLEAERRPATVAQRASGLRGQVKWGKLMLLAVPLLLLVAIGLLHVVPFTAKIAELEASASEQLGQPVKITSVHLSLFPPQWRLDGVTIGSDAQIRAARIHAVVDLGELFGTVKNVKLLELESPMIKPQALGWILFGKPDAPAIRIAKVQALSAKLDSGAIDLPPVDVKAELDASGAWQKLVVEYADKSALVELSPGNGRPHFEISANNFVIPFGSTFAFDRFNAKGSIGDRDINVSEFEASAFGGRLNGNAALRWSDNWILQGDIAAKDVRGKDLLPALLSDGHVSGRGHYSMLAANAKTLADATRMEGNFLVGEGAIDSADLMRLLNSGESGKVKFLELSGGFSYDRGRTLLRPIRLAAGVLTVGGGAEADAAGRLQGGFTASYNFDNQHTGTNFNLGGTLKAPRFSH